MQRALMSHPTRSGSHISSNGGKVTYHHRPRPSSFIMERTSPRRGPETAPPVMLFQREVTPCDGSGVYQHTNLKCRVAEE
jgi:hypothetical protein